MRYTVLLSTAEDTRSYPSAVSRGRGERYLVRYWPQTWFPAARHRPLIPAYKAGKGAKSQGILPLSSLPLLSHKIRFQLEATRPGSSSLASILCIYGFDKSYRDKECSFFLSKPAGMFLRETEGTLLKPGDVELQEDRHISILEDVMPLQGTFCRSFMYTVSPGTLPSKNGIFLVLESSRRLTGDRVVIIDTGQETVRSGAAVPLFEQIAGQRDGGRQAVKTKQVQPLFNIKVARIEDALLFGQRPADVNTALYIKLPSETLRRDLSVSFTFPQALQIGNKAAVRLSSGVALSRVYSFALQLPQWLAADKGQKDTWSALYTTGADTSAKPTAEAITAEGADKEGHHSLYLTDRYGALKQGKDTGYILLCPFKRRKLFIYLIKPLDPVKVGKPIDLLEDYRAVDREPGEGEIRCISGMHWEELWEDLYREYGPRTDRLQLPPVDFDYKPENLYDKTTGTPYAPLTSPDVPDVMVEFPGAHPVGKYADVGLKIVNVHLWILRDVIMLLYRDRKEHSLQYEALPPGEAIRTAIDRLYYKLRSYDYRREEYQRTFRMARWYGEYVIVATNDHWLVRSYDPWFSHESSSNLIDGLPAEDRPYIVREDGWCVEPSIPAYVARGQEAVLELSIENLLPATFDFTIEVKNTSGAAQARFLIDNKDKSYLLSAFARVQADLPAGKHSVLFEFIPGSADDSMELNSMKADYVYFKSAEIIERPREDVNGGQAVDMLIDMLLRYYDLHHEGKEKGTRLFNLSTPTGISPRPRYGG